MGQKLHYQVLYQTVVLVGILIFTLSACNLVNNRGAVTGGADTDEEVVNTYLRALEKRDKRSILALIPENLIGQEAVKAKIEKLGGHDLRFAQVCYLPLKPLFKNVTIQGQYRDANDKNVKFKDEFSVSYFEQNWYLMMGKPKNPTTVPTAR